MPTPVAPRNFRRAFRGGPIACGSDSAMNESLQRPIFAHGTGGCAPLPGFPLLSGEYVGCIETGVSHSRTVLHRRLCLRTNVVETPFLASAASRSHVSASAPEALHHARWPRSRLSTAGFHARRQEGFALSHFFPRSVGFGPTASNARGAFTMSPSMLCHIQAMPSISSYSANPSLHMRRKTPWRFHARKYLWTELALPYSFGNAFHWQPVRRTYTIPSKTFRGSIGFRPPPGFLVYFFPFSRFLFGIRGATFFHKTSETVHDFIAFIHSIIHGRPPVRQYYLRISPKCGFS